LAAVILLLLAAALSLGIGLQLVNEHAIGRAASLDRQGVSVEAEVLSVRIRRDEQRQRFVVYRYEVDGLPHRGSQTLRPKDLRPLVAGSPVTVRYVPGEPGRSWLLGYEPRGVPLTVVILGPAVLLFVAWLLTLKLRRDLQLLSEGRATEARVVGSKKVRYEESTGYKVEYEFRVLSGASRRAKLQTSNKPPAPGTIVTLLYHPDDDRHVAIYPLLLVRVARNA